MEESQPSLPLATTSNPFDPTALVVSQEDWANALWNVSTLYNFMLVLISFCHVPPKPILETGVKLVIVGKNFAKRIEPTVSTLHPGREYITTWWNRTNPRQIQRKGSYYSCSRHAARIGCVCICRYLILYTLFYNIGQRINGTYVGIDSWRHFYQYRKYRNIGHTLPFIMLCSCPLDWLCRQRPQPNIHGWICL